MPRDFWLHGTCVANHSALRPLVMPQPGPRGKKRKRQPEEVPSSASTEVFTVTATRYRSTKKRVVEGTKFEACGSPSTLLSTETPYAPPSTNVDTPQPLDEPDTSTELSLNATSRSVSVSLLRRRHVSAR